VHAFFHAVRVFFDHLAAVGWESLGIALACHFARLLLRAVAWRNILRAAYPTVRVPRLGVLGAYLAAVGVNSIVPARGGDALRAYLIRHRIEGSSYPTIGATLIVETLFDSVVAGALLAWAIARGVLPSIHALPHLPSVDWSWPLRHPGVSAVVGGVWLAVLVLLAVIGARRVRAFRERVRQGFTVLADRPRFAREVLFWQAASWGLRLASVYWFLRAFGLPATVHNALLVLVVQSLSTLFPFTPGGAGTQQGLIVYVFGKTSKLSRTAVLSFSVGMQFAVTALNVLLGFAAILLMLRTLRWRDVVVGDEEKAYARRA